MASRRPLAVTMGDPAGCGPQITLAAWRLLRRELDTPFYVIGAPDFYGESAEIITSPDEAGDVFARALPVLPLDGPCPLVETGTPEAACAPAILECIETATRQSMLGTASGVVTNPISKAVLYGAGFKHPGHTEYIAALCSDALAKPVIPVMMLVGGGLRVALATIHVPYAQVPEKLTRPHLERLARIVDAALKRDFAIDEPHLAFTGLNPHAGETGMIGREEMDVINPAAEALRESGVKISDARPGDTVFAEMLSGRFNAVIAMTHDQALIPVKTLDFWGGVNTTLGLPIIRTSPDHGTAYDVAARGEARPDSLVAAIRLASEMADNRVRAA